MYNDAIIIWGEGGTSTCNIRFQFPDNVDQVMSMKDHMHGMIS